LYSQTKTDGKETYGTAASGFFVRQDRASRLYAYYDDYSPNFQAQNGFISAVDQRYWESLYTYYFRPKDSFLTYWAPTVSAYGMYEYDGEPISTSQGLTLTFEAPTLALEFKKTFKDKERYNDINYYPDYGYVYIRTTPSRYVYLDSNVTFGEGLHYSDPVELGDMINVSSNLTLTLLERLKLTTNFLKKKITQKGSGDILSNQDTWREKIEFQFTDKLASRLIYDYTTIDTYTETQKTMTGSALLSYIVHPGTAFYIGFDSSKTQTPEGRWAATGETIFSKLTYRFN
ncbi:MAG: hypothetical protein NTW04_06395, partial [Elusimicrobia bacterium]|nr:hypothetical protein [Elusimicrobiota bacterium]